METIDGIDIRVRKQNIEVKDSVGANRYSAIVREDTGRILSIVGADYKITQYADLVRPVDSLVRQRFGEEVKREDRIQKQGGRLYTQWLIPTVQERIGGDDSLYLVMGLESSHDGSLPHRYTAQFKQALCSNLAMWKPRGVEVKSTKRHCLSFDLETFQSNLKSAMFMFQDGIKTFKRWADTMPTEEQTKRVIKSLPKRMGKGVEETFRVGSKFPYHNPRSAWGLYSVITESITHEVPNNSRNGDYIVTQKTINQKVNRIMEEVFE